MTFVGGDTDQLRRVAGSLHDAASTLQATLDSLTSRARQLSWSGQDFDCWSSSVSLVDRSEGHLLIERLRDAATTLRWEADQQDGTSLTLDGMVGPLKCVGGALSPSVLAATDRIGGWLDTGGLGVTRTDLQRIQRELAALSPADRNAALLALAPEQLDVLRDQLHESPWKGGLSQRQLAEFFTAVTPGLSVPALAALLGRDMPAVAAVYELPAHASVNQAVSSAMGATGEGGPGAGEIEVRRLDTGRYVVVLPGVTDLSDSMPGSPAPGELWKLTNLDGRDLDTPRDMHYAIREVLADDWQASSTNRSAYAVAVKAAMQAAGVPAGAPVMLVGHSYGAYTAMALASDPLFNSRGATGSYHVDITNVVTGGAPTGALQEHVVNGTSVLSLRNSNDGVATSEALLGSSSQEVVFAGGTDGWGHRPTNYVGEIDRGNPAITAYTDRVDPGYASGGQVVRVAIPDPYWSPSGTPR